MSIYDISGNVISTDAAFDESMVEALAANGDPENIAWEQGTISTTGSNSSANNRVRTATYLGYDSCRYIFIHCPSGYKFSYRRYNAVQTPTFVDTTDWLTGNQVISGVDGYLYRIVFALSNDAAITPSTIPASFYVVPVFRPIWSASAEGKSVMAYKTRRNNAQFVSEMLDVANTYWTNRSATHSGTRNMVYNNSSTIFDNFTATYTNGIDCSTFVGLCLRGTPYAETSYATLQPKPATEYLANPAYSWSVNPFDYNTMTDRTSTETAPTRRTSQLAQWMVSQRWQVEKDPKLANVEAGDVIFWSRYTGVNPVNLYRFMFITHVALVISKRLVQTYDATSTYDVSDAVVYNGALYECSTAITTAEEWTASHWTQLYATWDIEKFPYVHIYQDSTSGWPTIQQHVLETGWETSTITATNYNTITLVCRPDLGSL